MICLIHFRKRERGENTKKDRERGENTKYKKNEKERFVFIDTSVFIVTNILI